MNQRNYFQNATYTETECGNMALIRSYFLNGQAQELDSRGCSVLLESTEKK